MIISALERYGATTRRPLSRADHTSATDWTDVLPLNLLQDILLCSTSSTCRRSTSIRPAKARSRSQPERLESIPGTSSGRRAPSSASGTVTP